MQARAGDERGDAFDEVANLLSTALHAPLDGLGFDDAPDHAVAHDPERRALRVGEPDVAAHRARDTPAESLVNGGVHPRVYAVNDDGDGHTLARLRVAHHRRQRHTFY